MLYEITIIVSILAAIASIIAAVVGIREYKRENFYVKSEIERLAKEASFLQKILAKSTKESQGSERGYLKELAHIFPHAAIVASWYEIERTLEKLARQGYEPNLDPKLNYLLDELRKLRNIAAHHKDIEIDQGTALVVAELAEQIPEYLFKNHEAL